MWIAHVYVIESELLKEEDKRDAASFKDKLWKDKFWNYQLKRY